MATVSRSTNASAFAAAIEARLARAFPKLTVEVTPTDYANRVQAFIQMKRAPRGIGNVLPSYCTPHLPYTPADVDAAVQRIGCHVLSTAYPDSWAIPA